MPEATKIHYKISFMNENHDSLMLAGCSRDEVYLQIRGGVKQQTSTTNMVCSRKGIL